MSTHHPISNKPAKLGTLVALLMIATQVAGKATRDALFFSNFDVTALPEMLIAASLLGVVVVGSASGFFARWEPARTVPAAYALSAFLYVLEWSLLAISPRLVAIMVYLHIATFGAILISGFWSVINERFDPRTGKKQISRIATGGTVGGLLGGLLATQIASGFSLFEMLPCLAGLHLACAAGIWRIGASETSESQGAPSLADSYRMGAKVLTRRSYLQSLAALVLVGTIAAALLDYVFKAYATGVFTDGESLLRFFALYYTGIGLATVVFQGGLSRISLQKLGLAKTAGALPVAAIAGSFGTILFPALISATVARAAEAIVRNSLYRSAYELSYTPIRPQEKRAAKPIIDVGFERVGDALGGVVIRMTLFVFPASPQVALLLLASGLGFAGLVVIRRLQKGYVSTLEQSLRDRAVEMNLAEIEEKTTLQTLARTMATLNLSDLNDLIPEAEREKLLRKTAPRERAETQLEAHPDPVLRHIQSLRSGDPVRVRALLRERELDLSLVPHIIRLLAWDQVARDAVLVLRGFAKHAEGQLTDHLVSPEEDYAVRRRIPRVLSASPSQRTAQGLLWGLQDARFEVRFQCGRALASITETNPEIKIDREIMMKAVKREVAVDRRVWESHRLFDQLDKDEDSVFVDRVLEDRANRSLEHVFTLLALRLPREPLRIAFRGLHTEDATLKGTALEYLESILPSEIKEALWPFLEKEPHPEAVGKSREEILAELLESNASIQISLEEIRSSRAKQSEKKEEIE
jgi:hypothetical protein